MFCFYLKEKDVCSLQRKWQTAYTCILSHSQQGATALCIKKEDRVDVYENKPTVLLIRDINEFSLKIWKCEKIHK